MRVACVHIAGLAVQAALIENPRLNDRPLVIGGSRFDDGSVIDASVDATACGVVVGMSLRKAHSLCPDAMFLPRNDVMCDELFHSVLGVLDRFSPVVDVEEGLDEGFFHLAPGIWVQQGDLEDIVFV